MKLVKVLGLSMFVVLTIYTSFASADDKRNPEPVKLDLYVMSMCPFGTQAENAIFPAVKSLGPLAELRLHYIAGEQPEQPGSDGKAVKPVFRSLHGQPEVDENIRQLCAMKHYPDKYMDFILERNLKIRDADWQSAAKKVGLDPTNIEACAAGDEGAKLLSASIKESEARKAQSSPTIDINGLPYTGARGIRSVTLAMCNALTASGVKLPDACDKALQMPPDPVPGGGAGYGGDGTDQKQMPPVAFDVKVIMETSCSFCKPTLSDAIKRQHAGARVSVVDADSPLGVYMIARYNVRTLPFYYFDKKVEEDSNFENMKGYYIKTGDGYSIAPGADTYMPSIQLDRERVPHHLDVFVESNSPFTVPFEAQLAKMLVDIGAPDLTFSIHYIVQETVKGEEKSFSSGKLPSTEVRAASLKNEFQTVSVGPLTSRGGERELQEDMRQICLFQHASIGTFFMYLTCRNQNLAADSWGDTCLQMTDSIQKCLEGPEAENLLRQDARLVRDLGITAGPLLLWENRYGPFGWHEVDWNAILAEKELQ